MNNPDSDAPISKEPVFPRSHRLIRHLALTYGLATLAVVLLLAAALLPRAALPQVTALAYEVARGGLGAMVLSALLTALTALAGTLALTAARFWHSLEPESGAVGPRSRRGAVRADPGFAARLGQAVIVPCGALLVALAVRLLWPQPSLPQPATSANIAAAFAFGLAFVSLIAERTVHAFPTPQLPEAPSLRRVLLLTTVMLAAAACSELGRAAGLAWVRWPELLIACIPGLVAVELALRALARLFLPPPSAPQARAVTQSLLAGVLTGGPRAPATLLRTHLGLDFARSWALAFLSAAMLPALAGTALLCWILSGVKLINLEHRGIYERFGAPVAVLGPGLHLIAPWPFGRLRSVEYGTIHAVPIGVDASSEQKETQKEEQVGAEATPPLSLNRLWESAHPDQAHYLVPSAGTAQQSFQSVSTEIYVLYRVGLSDAAALQSVYTVADPESLIKEAASRLVLRYFNSRTLDAVLGARRENVAGSLRAELQADPAVRSSGIDIVSVLIEEIHPPAGAAAAYHAVQAAEINANASIANERGRAKRTAGVAQEESHQLTAAADAHAAEIIDAAQADAYRFGADHRAYTEGKQSFLLERSFAKLEAALARSQLTLIDHRLSPDQLPILDLRSGPLTGASAAGGMGAASGPAGASGSITSAAPAPLVPDIEPEY
ncbi:MAG TPA: SPFH domain-containing protein [Steroidobacteraceae bacterium]|nr:SPFH domain-containing protein [Steroidobacteraceae bacterium]